MTWFTSTGDREGRMCNGTDRPGGRKWFWLAFASLTAGGVLVRLAFFFAAGELESFADESAYVFLAVSWLRFGFYSGIWSFLWPPGYPAFLLFFLDQFGPEGLEAAKLCQVVLSGLIGAFIMLLAKRMFSERAALIAGGLWVIYLPLIGYTHYLWPETLFLCLLMPLIYLVYVQFQGGDGKPWERLRVVAIGVLVSLALLLKESVLPFILLVILALLIDRRQGPLSRRLLRGTAIALTVGAIILPWSMRNYHVYGRPVLSGSTLGVNLFWGLNGSYWNFDYGWVDYDKVYPAEDPVYRLLISSPEGEGWKKSEAPNIIDRSKEDARRARNFALANPGFALRSRIKKVADWVTPSSFFVRHYALGYYEAPLAGGVLQPLLASAALALTVFVLLGAVPGFLLALKDRDGRTTAAITLLSFAATGLLVSMSRYRLPTEALMLVLTAGALSGAGRPWAARRWSLLATAGGWLFLAALWTINARELVWLLRKVF